LISVADLTDINACGTTPSLSDLSTFGAVMVWSNFPFSQPDTLGNVLADFVDQGGGVALATYSFSQSWRIGGRILTAGYSPFTVSPTAVCTSGQLDPRQFEHESPNHAGRYAGTVLHELQLYESALDGWWVLIAVDTAGNRTVAVNPTNRVVGVSIFQGSAIWAGYLQNALNFLR